MKRGIFEDDEILKYLAKNYPGEGFSQHLERRLEDFNDLPGDEKVKINQKSLDRAKLFASLHLKPSGIFLSRNGNIRLLFENEQESFGVQILDEKLQVVQTFKK